MDQPPKNMRVLVLEHDDRRQRHIIDCLNRRGREPLAVSIAPSVDAAKALLAEGPFACVIMRHRLESGCSLDFLDECEDALLTTPMLALDRWTDPALVMAYAHHGCADFLDLDDVLRGDGLRHAVAEVISRSQRRAMATILERKQLADAILGSQEQLISMARVDALMGISNRAVFDDMHPSVHDAALREGRAYAVVMIDVDRFKGYNDRLGHVAGDDALRRVARAINAAAREQDFVARYGGEEIVMLLEDVDADRTREIAEGVRRAVSGLGIERDDGVLTISLGAALFDPTRPVPRRAVVLEADAMLYRAKLEGRDRVVVAGDPAAPASKAA